MRQHVQCCWIKTFRVQKLILCCDIGLAVYINKDYVGTRVVLRNVGERLFWTVRRWMWLVLWLATGIWWDGDLALRETFELLLLLLLLHNIPRVQIPVGTNLYLFSVTACCSSLYTGCARQSRDTWVSCRWLMYLEQRVMRLCELSVLVTFFGPCFLQAVWVWQVCGIGHFVWAIVWSGKVMRIQHNYCLLISGTLGGIYYYFYYYCYYDDPSGLRRGSAADHLLGLRVWIPPGGGIGMSVMSVVCCHVEVSATGWSLAQRSTTDCVVSLWVS